MPLLRTPPQHTQILVVGGGPSGSYAAAALAREGFQVVLFESVKFPRYHIGESLIPSVRPYLRFIGAEDKVKNTGFFIKPGAAVKFNQHKKEGYTDFVAMGADNNAWNVTRSQFDEILLRHSQELGADVYEEIKVTSFDFASEDEPTAAHWVSNIPNDSEAPSKGVIHFDYLVDASGRNGLMSTKYLKNRRFNETLKNMALWGYWRGCGSYGRGTTRENAPYFEALTDESGWAWFIPLSADLASVGVVVNQERFKNKDYDSGIHEKFFGDRAPNPTDSKSVIKYLTNLTLAPNLGEIMTSNSKMDAGSVKSAADFSYSAPKYGGSNYRLVGDAGAFIDPFFSSGIHMAFTSGLSAAASISATIRSHCTAQEAASWHTTRFATSYSRFQLVVLSAYKQFQNQSEHILADIDEDNFDRAFGLLRPVIQGASDMGSLTENELQNALDFCLHMFNPTSPEEHAKVKESGDIVPELMDVTRPLAEMESLSSMTGEEERELVLKKVNARKVLHQEYAVENLENESLDGLAVQLIKGELGLKRISVA